MRTVFEPMEGRVKQLAYGLLNKQNSPINSGQLYRLERGFPFQKAGKFVPATPQFKSQVVFSYVSKNAQLPTNALTPVFIIHPGRIGAKYVL